MYPLKIESDPDFSHDKQFKLLKEALAKILNDKQRGWLITPS
jgi:hypothetical protein